MGNWGARGETLRRRKAPRTAEGGRRQGPGGSFPPGPPGAPHGGRAGPPTPGAGRGERDRRAPYLLLIRHPVLEVGHLGLLWPSPAGRGAGREGGGVTAAPRGPSEAPARKRRPGRRVQRPPGQSPRPERTFESNTVLTGSRSLRRSPQGRGERVPTVLGSSPGSIRPSGARCSHRFPPDRGFPWRPSPQGYEAPGPGLARSFAKPRGWG